MTPENKIEETELTKTADFLPSDGASCSAFFRPRNGDELMQAIAEGKTCEVPNGWGMKALAFLESRLKNWSIYFDSSTNKGWSILRPTGDTPERFRRYLQNSVIVPENGDSHA